MADEINEQEGADVEAPKKKSKKLLFIILIAVVLMAGGAGGFLYWLHRVSKHQQSAAAGAYNKEKPEVADEEVAEVVELLPFIVNLADREEPKYLRMTVSLGISEASEKPDPLFTTKIRNAILA